MEGINEHSPETELAKVQSRIRSSRLGCIIFSSIYACAAAVFLYLYIMNKGTENLVLSLVLLFLVGASIHGYRLRIAADRARESELLKQITPDSSDRTAQEPDESGG